MGQHRAVVQRTESQSKEIQQAAVPWKSRQPMENEIGRRCFVEIKENKASLTIHQANIPHLTLNSHFRKE